MTPFRRLWSWLVPTDLASTRHMLDDLFLDRIAAYLPIIEILTFAGFLTIIDFDGPVFPYPLAWVTAIAIFIMTLLLNGHGQARWAVQIFSSALAMIITFMFAVTPDQESFVVLRIVLLYLVMVLVRGLALGARQLWRITIIALAGTAIGIGVSDHASVGGWLMAFWPFALFMLVVAALCTSALGYVRRLVASEDRSQELQEVLAESERLLYELGTVFETVQDGLTVYDAQGCEIHRNQNNRRILDLNQIPGQHVRSTIEGMRLTHLDGSVIPYDDYPVPHALRGEDSVQPIACRVRRADGTQSIIEISAVPLLGPGGDVMGALGVLRDISVPFRQERHNTILRAVAHACASAVDVQDLCDAAVNAIHANMDIRSCSILIEDNAHPGYLCMMALYASEDTPQKQLEQVRDVLASHPYSPDAPLMTQRVMALGTPIFDFSPPPLHTTDGQEVTLFLEGIACVPLTFDGKTFGVITIGYTPEDPGKWDDIDRQLILAVADEVGTSLHRARLYEEARRLAWRDPLTGLHNHRAMQQVLQETVQEATVQNLPVSVIMLDVDHFRMFNERFGHDVGDQALRLMAQTMLATVRGNDIVARYGGEEFAIILPATDMTTAGSIAERVRQAIAAARVPVKDESEGVPITASVGFATFPLQASVPATLLKAADVALYAAKHAGRNCVRCYDWHLLPAQPQSMPNTTLPADADLEMIQALINAIDLRDGFTAAHSDGVSRYAVAIATKLEMSPEHIEMLRIGGLLHDIGKIGVPDAVLGKPGALTPDEWDVMRAHTVMGAQIMQPVTHLHHLLPLVRSHHERLDGSGYPDGLRAAEIPLVVRILSVADVFEAFTTQRPYHPARSMAEGLALLRAEASANRLDSAAVAALESALAITALPADGEAPLTPDTFTLVA